MAIEITKRGRLPAERPYIGTCYTCKTEIKCKESDGQLIHARDQRDRDSLKIKCPLCGSSMSAYLAPEHYGWGNYYDR